MSLIACEECRREISRRATACPHCGCPVGETPGAIGTYRHSVHVKRTAAFAKFIQFVIGCFTLIAICGAWYLVPYLWNPAGAEFPIGSSICVGLGVFVAVSLNKKYSDYLP